MKIRIDTEVLEGMLFVWASLADREKIADRFLIDLAESDSMKAQYDEEFNEESVRKVLSAIANRERLNNPTKKESRFWNNNLWMMEDPLIPESMLGPVKRLSARELEEALPGDDEKKLVFYPGTTEASFTKGDTLYVNFFRIMADPFDDSKEPRIEGLPIKEYLIEKLK